MLVVSPNFVLSLDDVAYQDADLNNPIVGWQSIVTADNLSVTSENELYPAENLLNSATNLVWIAEDDAEQTIEITTGGANDVDYVGIARHNFGTAGIQVSVEVNDGAGWDEAVPPFAPSDDSPLVLRFTRGSYTGVRVILSSGDQPARVAVLYVGQLLVLQRRVYVGHTPIEMSRKHDVLTGMSESGEYLGRVVVRESLETSVNLQNLTPRWYREYMQPFVEASADTPFFFAWRPSRYSDEVGFCWMRASPRPVNQRPNGMMSVQLDIGGLTL